MKTLVISLIFVVFAFNLKGKNAPLPYRIATVEKVIQQLFVANGNFQIKKPAIEMRMTQKQVAAYIPDKNLVIIEDKAYEICQSMGKDSLDALAFLIGHELTHAYQNAKTKTGFVSNFLSYDKTKNADTFKEKEADIQGAFNAYLAGYDIKENIPTILEKIYIAYQLKDKVLEGYPTYEERLQVGKDVQNKVNELIQVYETANLMTSMGQYNFAQICYEYILNVYQNREIYNNMGVVSALAATELSSKNSDNWMFPYEMDWQTRLMRKKSRGEDIISDEIQKERIFLLKQAQNYFETASELDKKYTIAPINALCVAAQLGHVAEVEKKYKQLLIKDNNAKLAYAIALCHNQLKQHEAEALLMDLKSNTQKNIAYMAAQNLAILHKMNTDFDIKTCGISSEMPVIDEIQLHKLTSSGQNITLNSAKKAQLILQKYPNSTVVQAKMKNGYYFAFQRTKKNVVTEGVLNSALISTSVGYISVCDDAHVAFRYDRENKLLEWIKYYGN